MRLYSYLLPAVGGVLLSLAATAQVRTVSDLTAIVPELQAEVALAGDDYLLASFSTIAVTGRGYGTEVQTGQLRLGYEHFWSPQWSGGATLRLVGKNQQGNGEILGLPGSVTPGLLLRHSGKIGPLSFGQRLGVEYAIIPGVYRALQGETNRGLARLRLDLDHVFVVSEKLALRPRLAYEAVAYLRFQRDQGQLKERFIDFGSLRGELGLRFSPHFDVTPWVAAQTIYRNSLQFYNPNGTPTGNSRYNYVIPVVGLDLRFTIFPGGSVSERRQLPSQH